MVGFGANRRGGRLPSFILIALMVVILVLSLNYWTVSSKHGRLLDELMEVQTQVKRTDAARSRLEKRNSELMAQVDSHRKQIDQKDGDFAALEGKLQVRESLIKRCSDDKVKLHNDVITHTSEVQRLNEQLKDLRQEFLKQEEQVIEVRRNSTYLERKLEYDSLQCGRQIAQLKEDYEEKKKALEVEAAKLKKSLLVENRGGGAVGGHADRGKVGEKTKERDTVDTQQRDSPELKAVMGKPGSDAGMPGIEDSEVGKVEELQFALKRPAITQSQLGRGGDKEAKEDRGGAGAGAGDPALDRPDLQRDGAPLPGVPLVGVHLPVAALPGGALPPERIGLVHMQQPPPPAAVGDRPVLFDEDSKAVVHADELGESRRQLRAPDGGKEMEMKGAVLPPPNPAQVLPNPAQMPHHRQNDEDRELQGDRPVDYGKRHKAIDIL